MRVAARVLNAVLREPEPTCASVPCCCNMMPVNVLHAQSSCSVLVGDFVGCLHKRHQWCCRMPRWWWEWDPGALV